MTVAIALLYLYLNHTVSLPLYSNPFADTGCQIREFESVSILLEQSACLVSIDARCACVLSLGM